MNIKSMVKRSAIQSAIRDMNFGIFGDGSDGDVTVNADPFTSGPITNNKLTKTKDKHK